MAESTKANVVAVIPARYASTRYPGKVIAPLLGHPLIYHTWCRASRARLVDRVIIATDAPEVVAALAPYDLEVIQTRGDHATGTDRIAEVAADLDADVVVNLQGDEPAIEPAAIDAAIAPLLADPSLPMTTVRRRIADAETVRDPNVVKVVCDQAGDALYFSRLPIPFVRDAGDCDASAACYWQHIGLYVYRREFLLKLAALPQTPLERLEKLEQLRALENGFRIGVVETEYEVVGVDVPADLAAVSALLEQRAMKESE